MELIRTSLLPELVFSTRVSHRTSSDHRIVLAIALLALALWPASVHAGGLTMSLDDVTGPTAGKGTFEVLLANTNPAGEQSFDVASFSFQLSLPTSSGVQFTDATTATVSAPYIFQGTGGASVDPNFKLSLDSFPNTNFSGSDAEFASRSISVAPGDSFGLGFILYSIAANALPGDVPIAFVPDGTSLSDATGGGIGFQTDTSKGIIPISSAAVPESSSLVLTASATLVGLLFWRYRESTKVPGAPSKLKNGRSYQD